MMSRNVKGELYYMYFEVLVLFCRSSDSLTDSDSDSQSHSGEDLDAQGNNRKSKVASHKAGT